MNVALTPIQEELFQKYKSLALPEQIVLEIFSIMYENFLIRIVYDLLFPRSSQYLIPIVKELKITSFTTFETLLKQFQEADLLTVSHQRQYICNPIIRELITREAAKRDYYNQIYNYLEKEIGSYSFYSIGEKHSRFLRVALYNFHINPVPVFEKQINTSAIKEIDNIIERILTSLGKPFDPQYIERLPSKSFIVTIFFTIHLERQLYRLNKHDVVIEYLLKKCKEANFEIDTSVLVLLVEHLSLQGRYKDRDAVILNYPDEILLKPIADIFDSFFVGNFERVISKFESLLATLRKITKKRNYTLVSSISVFYLFSLIKTGESDNYQQLIKYIDVITKTPDHVLYQINKNLETFWRYISGQETTKNVLYEISFNATAESFWCLLSFSLIVVWLGLVPPSKMSNNLESCIENLQASNYKWLKMQAYDILSRLKKNTKLDSKAEQLRLELGSFYLYSIYQAKEEWMYVLKALNSVVPKTEKGNEIQEGSKRLAWVLFLPSMNSSFKLEVYEQTFSQSKMKWSGGRFLSLYKLKLENEKMSYLTEYDKRIIASIESNYRNEAHLSFQGIKSMVGHPNLYINRDWIHVQMEEGTPELRVFDISPNELKISFYPTHKIERTDISIEYEPPGKLKYIEFLPEHNKIQNFLSKDIIIPKTAKEEVLRTLTALSGIVTIQSDIVGEDSSQAEIVISSSVPHIQLYPSGLGLKLVIVFRPFGEQGPYYKPNSGGRVLLVNIEGKRQQTTRDFVQENSNVEVILNHSPTLVSKQNNDQYEWILENPEDCLQVLLDLQILGDKIIIEWPEGEKYKIKKSVGTSNFKMNIRKENDWFSISGDLNISDSEILEMQTLMELLQQSPGKFVKLKDGSFIALTEEFRKQLEEIRAYSEYSKNGYKVSNLVIPLFEDMASQVAELKVDREWKEHLQKLKDLKEYQPTLPSTFQASLREYQKEGFEWLSRLSKWKVGACLADDMGLGKTIQALTILLEHAPTGPSLIVAPTSVCMNWHNEVSRYAPTLNSIQFGMGDREKMISDLKPFDLLVCSYGMIQQSEVAEILRKVKWQVIVLDEAQAIKNMTTKRSQAVMNLEAEFKLITTGTPIENHLGELWNLFRFLNPGLLGSLESFNQRFAIPIERNKDKEARTRLKKLIQPFILRRMKNDVLQELPEKTEITHVIELNDKEKAFYEALRLNAIKKLSEKDIPDGQKHIAVLAEIMKLRRACCNTQLVEKGQFQIPSSKLEAFEEILEELLENKHKALVFSQFVDHLSIIKEKLDAMKVSYQYLDGSTPIQERQKRVEAFQKGDGDVFLISLKAGGAGLNLTAADYVIHMDPWWNPAVEDQASDRAHRIGQKRPVTVYRIITKDTIEEKIIKLHQDKRDLANNLLEETDMSGKMSVEDLLNLLKG